VRQRLIDLNIQPTKDRARKPRRAKTTFAESAVKSPSEPRIDTTTLTISEPAPPLQAVSQQQTEAAMSPPSRKQSSASRMPDASPPARDREPTPSPPTSGASRRVHFPLEIIPVASQPDNEKTPRSPATPLRHSRIPSTGNRATVMDVAQALTEHEEQSCRVSEPAPSALVVEEALTAKEEPEVTPRLDVKSMISNWGVANTAPSPLSPAKRTSSYEKYSAFVMPPLLEEKTPVASPANSLRRNVAPPPNLAELETTTSPLEGGDISSTTSEEAKAATADEPELNKTPEQLTDSVSARAPLPMELESTLEPEQQPHSDISVEDSFIHLGESALNRLPRVY
jgi:hypothetical protein